MIPIAKTSKLIITHLASQTYVILKMTIHEIPGYNDVSHCKN